MNYQSTQFATSKRIGIYESNNQIGTWADSFKTDSCQNTGASAVVEADRKAENKLEGSPHEILGLSKKYDHEANKPSDKVLRRLAQNREAARKSRVKKKAYVQQLESSRLKLAQMEQELEQARQQGLYIGGQSGDSALGGSGTFNSDVWNVKHVDKEKDKFSINPQTCGM